MDFLLLFLAHDGAIRRWLLLSAGTVAARGTGPESLPPRDPRTRIFAIVPGDLVALHWLDLGPGLSPPQALAAARLLLAERSAQPLADTHVAVGREEPSQPLRAAALIEAAAMLRCLESLAILGIDPDSIVPETLLLPAPAEGLHGCVIDGLALLRGPAEAFAAEPELAALILAGRTAADIDGAQWEAALPASLSPPLLDLRQGAFARPRRWKPDAARVRRVALLTAAAFLATAAIEIAATIRYTFAADAEEAQAQAIGGATPGALGARLSDMRGGGAGYAVTAGEVFAAVRDTPNAELGALTFSPDGTLRTVARADSGATLAGLQERLRASGFDVQSSPPRTAEGLHMAELRVRRAL